MWPCGSQRITFPFSVYFPSLLPFLSYIFGYLLSDNDILLDIGLRNHTNMKQQYKKASEIIISVTNNYLIHIGYKIIYNHIW